MYLSAKHERWAASKRSYDGDAVLPATHCLVFVTASFQTLEPGLSVGSADTWATYLAYVRIFTHFHLARFEYPRPRLGEKDGARKHIFPDSNSLWQPLDLFSRIDHECRSLLGDMTLYLVAPSWTGQPGNACERLTMGNHLRSLSSAEQQSILERGN
jgi:hypothetical protein